MSEAVVAGTSERLIRDVSHTPQEVWLEYWLTHLWSFFCNSTHNEAHGQSEIFFLKKKIPYKVLDAWRPQSSSRVNTHFLSLEFCNMQFHHTNRFTHIPLHSRAALDRIYNICRYIY